MNSSLFLLFLLASAANIISPGAGVVMAVSTAIETGFKGSLACRLGLAAGIAVIMTLSVSGLGLIVSTHPAVYTALRLLGVCYLVYLGVRAWRAPAVSLVAGAAARPQRKGRQFLEAFWLQISNPQAIIFSISILPQFIDSTLPYAPQAALMTSVYALMVFAVMSGYSWAAGKASVFFKSAGAARLLKRSAGVVFLLLAALVVWTMIRA